MEGGAADYIVVGAGSAGCVVAAKLARSCPNKHVLLVEAGTEDSYTAGVSSTDWLWNAQGGKSEVNYGYRTTKQTGLNGRAILYPRGKGVGGSSLLNAMNYARGFAEDFEQHWPQGWKSKDVAPSFEEIERELDLQVLEGKQIGKDLVRAASQVGHKALELEEAPGWEAVGARAWSHSTLREGKRLTTFNAFVKPVLDTAGSNLFVCCDVRVERILLAKVGESQRAVGLRVSHLKGSRAGEEEDIFLSAREGSEVVLCLGAINTPQLLMVSGVGEESELASHGIPVVHPLSNVGKGLHDHILVPYIFKAKNTSEFTATHLQAFMNLANGAHLLLCDGSIGPSATVAGTPETVFGHLREEYTLLRWLSSMVEISLKQMSNISLLKSQMEKMFVFMVALTSPTSRGWVKLKSKRMVDAPLINPAYLEDEADRTAIVDHFRTAREIVHAPPMDEWRSFCINPPPFGCGSPLADPHTKAQEEQDRQSILSHVKAAGSSYYHPVGSCRISSNGDGVVETDLRLKGIHNIRIADASVIPVIPRVPPAATIMMIGARCADFILQDATTPSKLNQIRLSRRGQ